LTAVEFERVSKLYPIYASPVDRLKEFATLNRRRFHRDFEALRDVSFEIRRGEIFCIVGENGSGKSTSLQLMAGIIQPSAGAIRVNGRVAALLELGAGFNPEFTGGENARLYCSILGLTARDIAQRSAAIESFAEIGGFIHQPVRTYSSGMLVRLAFACAIHTDPEILIVDEALSVGDAYFRQKCVRRIHELRARGVTIVFVSHAVAEVKAIGERVLWLDRGQVAGLGDPDSVISAYAAAMSERDRRYESTTHPRAARQETAIVHGLPNIDARQGDGRAEILGIEVNDAFGDPLHLMTPDTVIAVRISARASADIARPDLGFTLRNHLGVEFARVSLTQEGRRLAPMRPGEAVTAAFHVRIPELYPGSFSFSPFISDGSPANPAFCDFVENAVTIPMARGERIVYGYLHVPCRVEQAPAPQPAERSLA
jgi:ABC-type polysaccharide/polyol phosphate transport system ATPase subunit